MNFEEKSVKTALQIENEMQKLKNLFIAIGNEVLDEYNKGKISKKEMENILNWCQRIEKSQMELLKTDE